MDGGEDDRSRDGHPCGGLGHGELSCWSCEHGQGAPPETSYAESIKNVASDYGCVGTLEVIVEPREADECGRRDEGRLAGANKAESHGERDGTE